MMIFVKEATSVNINIRLLSCRNVYSCVLDNCYITACYHVVFPSSGPTFANPVSVPYVYDPPTNLISRKLHLYPGSEVET